MLTEALPTSSTGPQNNALQLTRSHGLFHTWSRFAAPRVLACGGPSQLNAVFYGLLWSERGGLAG